MEKDLAKEPKIGETVLYLTRSKQASEGEAQKTREWGRERQGPDPTGLPRTGIIHFGIP